MNALAHSLYVAHAAANKEPTLDWVHLSWQQQLCWQAVAKAATDLLENVKPASVDHGATPRPRGKRSK